jgi:hypothetical protein
MTSNVYFLGKETAEFSELVLTKGNLNAECIIICSLQAHSVPD